MLMDGRRRTRFCLVHRPHCLSYSNSLHVDPVGLAPARRISPTDALPPTMRTLLCVRRKPTSAPCAPAHHPFLLPRPPRPRNWIHTSSTFWEPRPSQNGCLFRKCYLRITCRLPSRLGHPTSASRMAGQAAPTLADRCADPSLNVWSGPTALSRLLSSLYQPSRPGCIGVARCFEDLEIFATRRS
jgi:hypothetical protein